MAMNFNPWNSKPQINFSAWVRVFYHCNRVLLRQALNKLCHNHSLIYLIQLQFYDFWKWKKWPFIQPLTTIFAENLEELNLICVECIIYSRTWEKYSIIFCGKSLVVMYQGFGRGNILEPITDILNCVLFWNCEMNSCPKQRLSFHPKQEWYRQKNLNLFY